MATKKKTLYAIVVDFTEGQYLDDSWLLGWDNKYDWYAADIDGCDIMTPSGRIKKSNWSFIDVDRWVSACVNDDAAYCEEYAADARREGYDCTVCRLDKVADGWLLVPVEKEKT
jgi:hypothetical protein